MTLRFCKECSGCPDGDFDLLVSSVVLRLASPVFDKMLSSVMVEGREKQLDVDIATKGEFANFYLFLLPGRARVSICAYTPCM